MVFHALGLINSAFDPVELSKRAPCTDSQRVASSPLHRYIWNNGPRRLLWFVLPSDLSSQNATVAPVSMATPLPLTSVPALCSLRGREREPRDDEILSCDLDALSCRQTSVRRLPHQGSDGGVVVFIRMNPQQFRRIKTQTESVWWREVKMFTVWSVGFDLISWPFFLFF